MGAIIAKYTIPILSTIIEQFLKQYYDKSVYDNFLQWKAQWQKTHSLSADLAEAHGSVQEEIDAFKKQTTHQDTAGREA